jgi:hypothetical protein
MYAPSKSEIKPLSNHKTDKRFLDAITDAMRQAMQRHPNMVIMGQDIAEYGGAFKATLGFVEEFGKGRVRNTPLCESAIVGTGLGLTLPTVPTGSSCVAAANGTQSINFVIGNYRIQGGFNTTDGASTVGLSWLNAFAGSPILLTGTTNTASPTSSSVANPATGVVGSLLPNTNFFWVAIGPA